MGDILGAIMGYVGSAEQADAIKAVNAAQIDYAKGRDQLMQELAARAKGRGQYPDELYNVQLPWWDKFQPEVAYPAAKGLYSAGTTAFGTPQQMIAGNQAIINRFQPMMTGAANKVGSLFNERWKQARLNEMAPSANARLALAATQKQGINTQLQQLKNQAEALSANRGFVGASTADRAADIRASTPLLQQAAAADAAARLANAQEAQGIMSAADQLALQNVGLPSQLAQTALSYQNLAPLKAAQDWGMLYSQTMSPFTTTPYQPPTLTQPPTLQAVPGTSAALANMVGSIAGYPFQLSAQKDYYNQLQAQNEYFKNMMNQFQYGYGGNQPWTSTYQQTAPTYNPVSGYDPFAIGNEWDPMALYGIG